MAADENDEIEAALRRMAAEFGPRPPKAGTEDPLPPLPPPSATQRIVPPNRSTPPLQPRRSVTPAAAFRTFFSVGVASRMLLALNIVVYLVTGLLSRNIATPTSAVLQMVGWKENALIFQGEYWRLLTAMFLHGNLVHIFFNGYALYSIGPETEHLFGQRRFLAVYLLSGLAGGMASYAFSPAPSVGASGAIFGLIGALAAFYYLAREVLGDFARMQFRNIAAIAAINLFIGFSANGVIDNYAHVGGLLGGALIGWLLAPRLQADTSYFPPALKRYDHPFAWPGVALVALGLLIVLRFIQPPL